MTSIHDLLRAVEASPGEWDRWLVLADALDEDGKSVSAYACRWCGTREQSPARRADVRRRPWCWLRGGFAGGPTNERLRGHHPDAVLGRVLFDEFSLAAPGTWRLNYPSLWEAVADLARALKQLRQLIEVRL